MPNRFNNEEEPVELQDEVSSYIKDLYGDQAADLKGAREKRDSDVGLSLMLQGMSEIGAGLGSQGRVKVDGAPFEAMQKNAAQGVTDLEHDRDAKRKAVQDFITNRRMEAHDADMADERNMRRDELKAFREATRQDRMNRETERREQHRADKLDKDTSAFSGQISKTGIPEAQNTFDQIDDVLAKPENRKNVPGYGFVEGTVREIPLVGKLIDAMSSGETNKMRQAVQGIMNVTLKDRSGAAVTLPEMERFKTEFGAGSFKTEEQLMTALKRVRDEFEQKKQNIIAGSTPESVGEYVNRGGNRRFVENTRPAWMNGTPETKVVNGVTYEKVDGGWKKKL